MASTGAQTYFIRDLYPEQGYIDTTELGVSSAQNQKVLETDEASAKQAEKVQPNATNQGVFLTVLGVLGVAILVGVLHQ